MMKYVYIGAGFVFFALGAVGAVLPILPTTPFLLLASYCFAKGSRRFHNWFTDTKLYRNHLDSFVQKREMTLKTKVCILSFASTMLLIPLVMMQNSYGRAFIVCLYIVKYYYFIFKIKTVKEKNGQLAE